MHSIPQKRCSKCGVEKPLSEFHRYRRSQDGHKPHCKRCSLEYMSVYHKENAESGRRRAREWQANNKDRVRETWKKNNKRSFLVSVQYKTCARCKVTQQSDCFSREGRRPDGLSVYCKSCLFPYLKTASHKRRAAIKGNGGSFTVQEWEELCIKYNHRCLCCGEAKSLTIDHVIPVSKGGSSNISNIQPLCKSCNDSKGTNTFDYRGGVLL